MCVCVCVCVCTRAREKREYNSNFLQHKTNYMYWQLSTSDNSNSKKDDTEKPVLLEDVSEHFDYAIIRVLPRPV